MDIHEIIAADKLVDELRAELREEIYNGFYHESAGDEVNGFQMWVTKEQAFSIDRFNLYARASVNGTILKFEHQCLVRTKQDIYNEITKFIREEISPEISKQLVSFDGMKEFLESVHEIV